jgi:hypothetical protein
VAVAVVLFRTVVPYLTAMSFVLYKISPSSWQSKHRKQSSALICQDKLQSACAQHLEGGGGRPSQSRSYLDHRSSEVHKQVRSKVEVDKKIEPEPT